MTSIRNQRSRSEQVTIPSSMKWMPKVVAEIERVVREMEFDEETGDFLAIATTEAVTNAIVHGNKEDGRKKVHIRFDLDPEKLTISVSDEGSGFDSNAIEDPTDPKNRSKRSGRGLFILKALMDEIDVSCTSEGTNVKMIKYKKGKRQPGVGRSV